MSFALPARLFEQDTHDVHHPCRNQSHDSGTCGPTIGRYANWVYQGDEGSILSPLARVKAINLHPVDDGYGTRH